MFFRPFSHIRFGLTLSLIAIAFVPCRSQTLQNPDTFHTLPSLLSAYVQYHNTNRENVYAQLNKSVYLADEQIWFKIYITDAQTGVLSYQTNKVYTDLYAPDGSLHLRKTWEVKHGCTYGQIHLPDTLLGGAYTFKAYTNWQQNFEPERIFTTQVQVKSFDLYPEPAAADSSLPWDIQFLPEGGDLIAGTNARIAVKGVDENGFGRPFGGKVFAEQNELLSFETNELGMGSFMLPPEFSGLNNLHAIISLPQGKTQKVSLPKPNALGVSLQVNAMGRKRIDILLNTNNSTLQSLANQPFYCLVHQNGIIAEMFTIKSLDNILTKIQIDKEQLPEGICTITLFDHSFRPVSERLFFAEVEQALGSIELTASRTSIDSVEVHLKMTDVEGTPTPALLSASVLPASSLAGDFTSNIYAHLFLTAEVRGEVENPAYYFKERSLERLQALDNLLLTQAWRKYEWNTILSPNPQPTTPYLFEYGFKVSGKSMRQTFFGNQSTTKSEVILNMPTDPYTKSTEIDTDGSFVFDSLLIYKPFNSLLIIAMDQKGEAGNRLLQEVQTISPELSNSIQPRPSIINAKEPEEEVEEDDSWLQFINPEATLLSAALVTAKRPTAREVMINDPFVSRQDKFFIITIDNMGYYNTIFDLLQFEFGFRSGYNDSGDRVVLGKRRNISMQTVLSEEVSEAALYPSPPVILNGNLITDWSILETLFVSDIEAVSVHDGTNVLLGGVTNGSIHIKTRTTPLKSRNARNFESLIVEGYDTPIAYYTPLYSNITNKTNIAAYYCLHWDPYLTSLNGESVFRFYAPNAEPNMRVRVEGIGVDGLLFSTDAQVAIPK